MPKMVRTTTCFPKLWSSLYVVSLLSAQLKSWAGKRFRKPAKLPAVDKSHFTIRVWPNDSR